jgi:hypothetical protein
MITSRRRLSLLLSLPPLLLVNAVADAVGTTLEYSHHAVIGIVTNKDSS